MHWDDRALISMWFTLGALHVVFATISNETGWRITYAALAAAYLLVSAGFARLALHGRSRA